MIFNANAFLLDMSQPSLSGMGDRDDRDRDDPTPPISPFIGSEGTSGVTKTKPTLYTQKSAPNFSRKFHQDSSLEADDTESELVAIPESDLSESTLHNSVPGSFDDGGHFDEMAQPLKPEQVKGKVTTANLATAQVALTTLGVAEREEKTEKKQSRLFMKLNSLDKIGQKHSGEKPITRCSVQEGVRMMVFMGPPPSDKQSTANGHRPSIGTQDSKTKDTAEAKSETKDVKDVSETDSSVQKSAISSMLSEASTSVAKQIAMGSTKSSSKHFVFGEIDKFSFDYLPFLYN